MDEKIASLTGEALFYALLAIIEAKENNEISEEQYQYAISTHCLFINRVVAFINPMASSDFHILFYEAAGKSIKDKDLYHGICKELFKDSTHTSYPRYNISQRNEG